MVRFRARDGRVMFAFDARTDPYEVMVEYAWAWAEPDRQSVCGMLPCPTHAGSYCVDCHCTAYNAVSAVRKRFEEEAA